MMKPRWHFYFERSGTTFLFGAYQSRIVTHPSTTNTVEEWLQELNCGFDLKPRWRLGRVTEFYGSEVVVRSWFLGPFEVHHTR